MSAVLEAPGLDVLNVNDTLFESINKSVQQAMGMCDTQVRCVGVSCCPTAETGLVTGMIGVHGKVSGFLSVNMAERFAIKAVEGLLQDSFGTLNSQVVDGAGEITNIIAGGVKSSLAKGPWGFNHITVPSMIVGQNFTIAYSRGLEYITVTFEHEDPDAVRIEDRTMHVSMSLLTL